MTFFKRISCIFAVLFLVGTILPVTAYAAPPSYGLMRWKNISSAEAGISASGTTVKPSIAIVAVDSSYDISGTLYLEKLSDDDWVFVKSWSVSGTGRLLKDKSYSGSPGTTYRSRFEATVNSEFVERTSSNTVTV